MRTPVICKNCNIKWLRVWNRGVSTDIEFNEDLQDNCPSCGSNWYDEIKEEE